MMQSCITEQHEHPAQPVLQHLVVFNTHAAGKEVMQAGWLMHRFRLQHPPPKNMSKRCGLELKPLRAVLSTAKKMHGSNMSTARITCPGYVRTQADNQCLGTHATGQLSNCCTRLYQGLKQCNHAHGRSQTLDGLEFD